MIDTHTHIFDPTFDADLPAVMDRAAQIGLQQFVLPAIDSQSHQRMLDLAQRYPAQCFATMGLHPTSVNDNPKWHDELALVERYLETAPVRFVAVGEVGLDFYWSRDFISQQTEALKRQVDLAIRYDLPLIIHVRDAWDQAIRFFEPYRQTTRGVFHSFSGTSEHWQAIQQMPGWYMGVNGTVTYKKSVLPDLLRDVPLARILLETDAPYLPPVPFRGKRNEPAFLSYVADFLSDLYGVSVVDIDQTTSANARRLFDI